MRHCDQRNPPLRNSRLLERNPRHGFGRHAVLRHEQEPLVIDPQRGDAAGGEHFRPQHIGRVEPPAEADFDNAGIGGRAAEGEEGGSDGRFEEAGIEPLGGVENPAYGTIDLRVQYNRNLFGRAVGEVFVDVFNIMDAQSTIRTRSSPSIPIFTTCSPMHRRT